jgi:hypothetical protein
MQIAGLFFLLLLVALPARIPGKGSPREGREELSGHCTLIASPQFLMSVQAGMPVPFACGETNVSG